MFTAAAGVAEEEVARVLTAQEGGRSNAFSNFTSNCKFNKKAYGNFNNWEFTLVLYSVILLKNI